MSQDLQWIMLAELLMIIAGFVLFFKESRVLIGPLGTAKGKAKNTILSLLGILFFINLVYVARFWGIFDNNPEIRQFGPALFAFIAAIFLLNWGALSTQVQDLTRYGTLLGIMLGTLFFVTGALFGSERLEIVGIGILVIIPVAMIFWLFHYVFTKSAYLFAKKRIFLMSLAFSLIIILEGMGVIAMRSAQFNWAAICFVCELPARFVMTLSILLPQRVQNFLDPFFK